jgi:hypothetical protein
MTFPGTRLLWTWLESVGFVVGYKMFTDYRFDPAVASEHQTEKGPHSMSFHVLETLD